jgi:hypothetical protein
MLKLSPIPPEHLPFVQIARCLGFEYDKESAKACFSDEQSLIFGNYLLAIPWKEKSKFGQTSWTAEFDKLDEKQIAILRILKEEQWNVREYKVNGASAGFAAIGYLEALIAKNQVPQKEDLTKKQQPTPLTATEIANAAGYHGETALWDYAVKEIPWDERGSIT